MRIVEALFNGKMPKWSTRALIKCFENPDCIFCKGIIACMRVVLRDVCANRAEGRASVGKNKMLLSWRRVCRTLLAR